MTRRREALDPPPATVHSGVQLPFIASANPITTRSLADRLQVLSKAAPHSSDKLPLLSLQRELQWTVRVKGYLQLDRATSAVK